jgi:hypothetical protein
MKYANCHLSREQECEWAREDADEQQRTAHHLHQRRNPQTRRERHGPGWNQRFRPSEELGGPVGDEDEGGNDAEDR